MATLERFLEPISPDSPCGEDLDADSSLFELDAMLKGEAATDYAEAQEPDWNKVQQKTLELLQRSRHLKLLVVLCLMQLKFEALLGFRSGLAVLQGSLEKYWDSLYPRLDTEDKDPTQRIHLVRNLSIPLGSDSPYRFIKWLRQIPLTDSTRMGGYSLEDILNAEKPPSGAAVSGRRVPTPAQVVAAFRDTKPETLQQTAATLVEIDALLGAINGVMTEKAGETLWPGLEVLENTVHAMAECLTRYAAPEAASKTSTGEGAPRGEGTVPGPDRQNQPSGVSIIQSREQASSALDKICEYYQRCEPGSPVPFLLRRAKRLIHLNFMESLSELAPSSVAPLKTVFGEDDQKQGTNEQVSS